MPKPKAPSASRRAVWSGYKPEFLSKQGKRAACFRSAPSMNFQKSGAPLCAIFLTLAFGIVAGELLKVFPPLNPDEVVVGVAGHNFAMGRGARYSLYDTIFAPSAYTLHDATNQESRPLYAAWVGLWTHFFPHRIAYLRASSWSLAMLSLPAVGLAGWGLADAWLGLAAMLALAACPIFWTASLTANEYMPLFFVETAILALAVTLP